MEQSDSDAVRSTVMIVTCNIQQTCEHGMAMIQGLEMVWSGSRPPHPERMLVGGW